MQIINKWIKKLTQLTDWPSEHDTTTRHTLGTVVPHDALASLTEKAHSSLTGIGASDHHAKTTAAGDITSGRFPVDRLPALTDEKIWKGTGGNVEEVDFPTVVIQRLQVSWLRPLNTTTKGICVTDGTGGLNSGNDLIDGDTTSKWFVSNVNDYAEILFPCPVTITQFRHYGATLNNGDGTWKLQYLKSDFTWADWVTGISTRATADWSNWDSSGGSIDCLGLKVVAVTLDTAQNRVMIAELEAKY